jgi:hypothetical protein
VISNGLPLVSFTCHLPSNSLAAKALAESVTAKNKGGERERSLG